jgi:hypothetical protein
MNEINKALEPLQQHDACEDCGKRTDGLMTCTYSHDGSTTKLCPDCMKDSGFCLMCGHYCSGQESFDFSDMPGYCSNCREEILADTSDDEDFYCIRCFASLSEECACDQFNDDYEDDFDEWNEDNNPNDSRNL